MQGVIYKSLGGFYYVKTQDGHLVECKPKGLFRKQGIRPVAGDRVVLAEEAGTPYIDEVQERRNVFVRPPVANVDVFFVVVSTAEPSPSLPVIDKLTAIALDQEAQPVVVVTKPDLADAAPLVDVYKKAGIEAFAVDAHDGRAAGLEAVCALLPGRLGVFCGNSGVGKSTLLNALLPQAQRPTAEISQKLGRGRHTTREVELFELAGGLVADTPGFASLDVQRASPILKENLQFAFPEIRLRMGDCRFTGCSHMAEAGCAVRDAVAQGEIAQSRYDSYRLLYEEAQQAEAY